MIATGGHLTMIIPMISTMEINSEKGKYGKS